MTSRSHLPGILGQIAVYCRLNVERVSTRCTGPQRTLSPEPRCRPAMRLMICRPPTRGCTAQGTMNEHCFSSLHPIISAWRPLRLANWFLLFPPAGIHAGPSPKGPKGVTEGHRLFPRQCSQMLITHSLIATTCLVGGPETSS